MWKPPTDSFEVKPPDAPSSGWPAPVLPTEDWQTDKALKLLFGIELAKGLKPFNAGLAVFGDNANKALWASHYWVNDPITIASRDTYKETVESKAKLLDKEALSVKLLEFADEKDATQRFYVNDGKDRLTALKLYAEVQGFIGKIELNSNTTINNNKLELILVKAPEKKIQEKIIETSNQELEILNPSPINLKLVSNR